MTNIRAGKNKNYQFGRVGVLYGGRSSEREVSLQSGEAVINVLKGAGIDVVALDLGMDPVKQILDAKLDRAFIALHGPGGEDGRLQGLLEFLKIPYTGSGVMASSLAMDKLRTKWLLEGCGLKTPNYCLLTDDSNWDAVMEQLGGTVFVKPATEGSSIGMEKVSTAVDLSKAFRKAKEYDSIVFAEAGIHGAEYTVTVLGDKSLEAIKLETDNTFYDYDAKYISDDTRYIIPCGLNSQKASELKEISLAAFRAVGCDGWGRVDVMADADENFYILEVNTVPGMTSHSLTPMAAKAEGISMEELVLTILSSANDRSV